MLRVYKNLSRWALRMLIIHHALLLVIALSIFGIFVNLWGRKPAMPLPPGPRGTLFTGNRSNIIGTKEVWKQYAEWSKIYGPVISIKSANVQVIVLSSPKAIFDLLDKRSPIYSDRPKSVMFGELVGLNKGFLRVDLRDPRFPAYRRMAHDEMGPRQIHRYVSAMEDSVKILLRSLLSDPTNFIMHLRNSQGRAMMKTTYGYTVESDNDYYVGIAERWMDILKYHMRPGQWLVDSYPFLKYLPQWMPGGGFKVFAAEKKAQTREALSAPMQWVKSEMSAGRAYPSFVSRQLSRSEELTEYDEEIVKQLAASMYIGGIDTVPAVFSTFFLMMIHSSDAQKRAQEEIDHVVGPDRLPRLSDKPKLPYVEALIKEILRYHPPSPIGSAHCVHQDDFYEGMFIPKGSLVYANIWAITHDESIYPDPFKFDPARHLIENTEKGKAQPDPRTFVFGFGRRLCPGMHVAEASIFLTLSSILATFNIVKSKAATGEEITPALQFTGGSISRPEEFRCTIVPRSDVATDLIMWSH